MTTEVENIIEFFEIPTWDGYYEISKCGKIKSLDRWVFNYRGGGFKKGRIMTPTKDGGGYLWVGLSKDGKSIRGAIHRILAITFIPNPENKPFVNHINGIKDDNRIENLEWCTHSENQKHAYSIGLKKKKSGINNPLFGKKGVLSPNFGKIGVLSPNTKIVLNTETKRFYYGVLEASKELNVSVHVLRQKLNGSRYNNTPLIYA